ncbi:MAG: tRNA threonylcarbamoyladenosine dehydratase [Bacteroidales bacterium]|nr:tRNA threonylcarbamoyladenosine dehydratase [Bacteroidales bacterium]
MDENHWLTRTELLIGREKTDKLARSHVLVAGLGGVGGYAAEAICRTGVGEMTIVDNDVVSTSNRNRQLLALKSTEGKNKADLMAERLLDINPRLQLHILKVYLKDEKIPEILNSKFDYVVDAIDTLSPKIFFIKHCFESGLPLVSSMGSGGRLDPSQIKVSDVSESYGCQFAQVVRKKLHGWGIRSGFKVVFSPEPVMRDSVVLTDNSPNKKSTVGTISYMPAIFGLTAASVVIRDLIDG